MSTPHMSGRADAADRDDGTRQLEPNDYLSDDGTLDTWALKSLQNNRVDPKTCAEIRRTLRGAADTSVLDVDVSPTASRRHARGECACPVTVPTVVYDGTKWVVDE